MPSFFKDLRRRSRASFKLEKSDSASSSGQSGDHAHDQLPNVPGPSFNDANATNTPGSKSSSNLANLAGVDEGRYATGVRTPPRPGMLSNGSSNRYSIVVCGQGTAFSDGADGQGSVNSSPRQTPYSSPYAPRVTSISDGSWVRGSRFVFSANISGTPKSVTHIWHHWRSFAAAAIRWTACRLPSPRLLSRDYVANQWFLLQGARPPSARAKSVAARFSAIKKAIVE